MDEEMSGKIDAADVPNELKTQLKRFGEAMGTLTPALSHGLAHRVGFMLETLVTEAIDENPENLWWEVALDLITKAAKEQGDDGQAVLDAAEQLAPLLRQKVGRYGEVTLEEITAQTVLGICLLTETLTEPKKNYVAPNAFSLAQAHFNEHAWFRAIYAGKAPVGFVMIEDNDEDQEYFLWRFMIAEPYHGRGYGRQAIGRLVEYVKTRPGAVELLTSCGQGEGSPEGFYVKLGFEHTGDKLGHEVVLRLPL